MSPCSHLNQEFSFAAKKDRLVYVKSHWKGSKIYCFSRALMQNFIRRLTMVADIFEGFEPPCKNFLATPLFFSTFKITDKMNNHNFSVQNVCISIYMSIYIYKSISVACTEEAVEMATKYLHNKKMCFEFWKIIVHYYNNGFEEDIDK